MLRDMQPLTLKKMIVLVLIALMYLVVLLSVIELAWMLIQDVTTPPYLLIGITELLDLLGLFLLVLVAIELLDTVSAYLDENSVHAEVVVEAAMIAVARKIIILDVKELNALTIVGIAAITLALAFAYQVIKSGHQPAGHGLASLFTRREPAATPHDPKSHDREN